MEWVPEWAWADAEQASVLETAEVKNKRDDVLSAIFAVIRDYFISNGKESVLVSELEKVISRRGYTAMQFQVGEGEASEE